MFGHDRVPPWSSSGSPLEPACVSPKEDKWQAMTALDGACRNQVLGRTRASGLRRARGLSTNPLSLQVQLQQALT